MKVSFSSPRKIEPDAEQGYKLPYAPSKRVESKLSWYLVLAIVCSPLMYVLFTAASSLLLVNEPGHISIGKFEVNSETPGRVVELAVEVGEDVRKGDVIARLSDHSLSSDISRVNNELSFIRERQNLGPNDEDLDALREHIRLARANYQFYTQQYKAMQTLFARRSATRADLNAARVTVQRAKLGLLEYETELEKLLGVPEKNRRLTLLESELEALQKRGRNLVQRAPIDGRVLDVFVRDSEIVRQGDSIALIGEPEKASVIAYLDPKYSRYAKIGQRARVELPGGETVDAHISALPEITHRLPSEFARPLGLRSMKILAHLDFDEPVDQKSQVEGLPVNVRFPFSLELAGL
ncbi:MAG: HlyD family secretion protein [Pseudomonadales bacterium]